jgi:hypothetical protein
MKQKTLLMTFLSAAAFGFGCDKDQTASQQIAKVQTDVKQAA